ncbi:MAG: hypothetical protein ACYDAZ_05090 [Thermoplasmataceae archaeon]
MHWYKNERRHSPINYLRPVDYYRGDPQILIAIREAQVERAKRLGRKTI